MVAAVSVGIPLRSSVFLSIPYSSNVCIPVSVFLRSLCKSLLYMSVSPPLLFGKQALEVSSVGVLTSRVL